MASTSYANAQILGNLARDAELRYTQGGTAVANFRVATNESYTNSDGDTVEHTHYFPVVVWAGYAEALAAHLTKGKQVEVHGQLQTRSWEDRDGNPRTTTEVKASEIMLLGGRRGAATGARGGGQQGQASAQPAQGDGQPF